MNALLRLAWLGARAHRLVFLGTGAVVALAAAMLSVTAGLFEAGTRRPAEDGLLLTFTSSFAGTALLVVVFAVSTTVAVTLRQRRREFALLGAVGATRAQIRALITVETIVLTLVAAPVGAVAGLFAAPALTPLLTRAGVVAAGFHLGVAPTPVLVATFLLVPVTALAGRLAARDTLRTPPTAAVRESAHEPRGIGRGRRITALVLAVTGLPVALTPVFVPGLEGAAAAAMSAFLLIGAAGVAGPLLVGWVLGPSSRFQDRTDVASLRLAVANSRGFARRLTGVVVPIAVALAIGTVQTSVDRSVVVATGDELRDGLHADLVATAPAGVTAPQTEAAARVPGVQAVTSLSSALVQIRTDEEAPGFLGWEPTSVGGLDTAGAALVDPDVTSGALADLARPGTVAVSTTARTDVGGLGSRVVVRGVGGAEHGAVVVAVYDRGLGFGDYLVGPATLQDWAGASTTNTLLLQTATLAPAAVEQLQSLGLAVVDKAAYVDQAVTASAGEQRLSTVLSLSLLVFLGLAAANALVLTTVGRRRELGLLQRSGAVRHQLVSMAVGESLVISVIAWVVGTLAVVPAVLGVSYGLTGSVLPQVSVTAFLGLTLATFALPLLCVVPTVVRQLRGGVLAVA